jgi:hypothetical protein
MTEQLIIESADGVWTTCDSESGAQARAAQWRDDNPDDAVTGYRRITPADLDAALAAQREAIAVQIEAMTLWARSMRARLHHESVNPKPCEIAAAIRAGR